TDNTTALTIVGTSPSDLLSVNGTQAGETITVNSTAVTVGTLKSISYTDIEALQVFGQAGNDTMDVTPTANTTILVDGGDPIGVTPGDRLLLHPSGAFAVEPGPESDEGGLNPAGAQRVSWDHIEGITVSPSLPGGVIGP